MPVTPTYPGVYIEELPSGVHTIVGVATSITAFLGQAPRGPANRAVHILSLKDYERSFGGLSSDSEMSYAVSQFFLNGGSEAYIVRLAKNAVAASARLKDSSSNDTLEIAALDEGPSGNDIQIVVQNGIADKTFNLVFNYAPLSSSADNRTETFNGLSMDKDSSRFVEDMVNDISQLVTVKVLQDPAAGTLTSDTIGDTDLASLKDNQENTFQISFNNADFIEISIGKGKAKGADLAAQLTDIAKRIQDAVHSAKPTLPAWKDFACNVSDSKLVLTSGAKGSKSSVTVKNAGVQGNNIAGALHLLQAGQNGAGQIVATPADGAPHPPVALQSTPGTLTSGTIIAADLDLLLDVKENSFRISFTGTGLDADFSEISIGKGKAKGADLPAQLTDIAARIQKAVHNAKPNLLAWRDFICAVSDSKLVLTSGVTGGKAIQVKPTGDAQSNNISDALHLVESKGAVPKDGSTPASLGAGPGAKVGGEESFNLNDDGLEVIFPTQPELAETGIFALDKVDLFNLLCIPAISNPAVIAKAMAYCVERRAFMIIDPPPDPSQNPPQSLGRDKMVDFINGPSLPKGTTGDHAALYYPNIKVADPLLNGKVRSFAPCGTIAGVYARTDSTRGVWKAPAGTDATLVGVQGLDQQLNDNDNGILNPHGVNCLRIFPVFGPVSWGARTVSGDDQIGSDYKYIPVRRTALYIEESLYRGLKWAVFEPNDEPLWAQIRLNAGAFMQDLFVKGAFQGKTPRDAYFVKCDKETTTQNDINLGIVNILVGFAPLKPAEFVIVQLQQIAGQIQV